MSKINKMGSRKLIAFAAACGMLALGTIDAQTWLVVACVYIGGQSAVDVFAAYKAPPPPDDEP